MLYCVYFKEFCTKGNYKLIICFMCARSPLRSLTHKTDEPTFKNVKNNFSGNCSRLKSGIHICSQKTAFKLSLSFF